jgi:ADP-ribose pyrophosphatase YjhB (NUDIX family)
MKAFFGKPTTGDAEPGGLHLLALVVPFLEGDLIFQRGQPYGQKDDWAFPMDTMDWNEDPTAFALRMLDAQVRSESRTLRIVDACSYPAKTEKDHWHLFLVFRADLAGEVSAGPDCVEIKRASRGEITEPLYFFDRAALLRLVAIAWRAGAAGAAG